MDFFDVSKINGSAADTVNTNISNGKSDIKKSDKLQQIGKDGITKPTIELDDFFAYLDPKVVEKILQTPENSRARIVKDVQQYEYDVNGAKNIFDALG